MADNITNIVVDGNDGSNIVIEHLKFRKMLFVFNEIEFRYE